jgi:tRNA(Ile)-lysidine synthase
MPAFSAKPVSLAEAKSLFAGLDDWPALVLAVSGGPDSTALMLLAARWRDALKGDKPKLIAVTVDHGLRPEAKREAAAVARLARKLKVTHRTLRWTGRKPATGLQQAARHARYRLLAEAARKAGASHILTAHTLDDQAETVLIRMSRGSGLTGLGAMQGVTALHEHSSFRDGAKRRARNPGAKHERVALDSGLAPSARPGMTWDDLALSIVRPLLDIPKARLIATLQAAKIPYAEDPSNRDPRFTRVRLRGLMAQLAGEGLTAPRLVQVAHRLRRADRALAEATDRAAAELARRPAVSGTLAYDAGGFGRLPAEVALRLLGRAVGALGDEGPVELAKLERLKSALDTARDAGLKRFRRTLAGALVTLAGDQITVERAPPRRSRALTTGRASGPKAR